MLSMSGYMTSGTFSTTDKLDRPGRGFPQSFDTLPMTFYAALGTAQTFTAVLDFTEGNRNAGDVGPKDEWVRPLV